MSMRGLCGRRCRSGQHKKTFLLYFWGGNQSLRTYPSRFSVLLVCLFFPFLA